MRGHLKLGWMLVGVLAAGLGAGERGPATVPATQPMQNVAWVKRLVGQLAADSYPIREGARVALMGLKRADLPALREAIKGSLPLEPSQVTVLREIVTQVYLAGDLYSSEEDEPGFLGVHTPFWGRVEERSRLGVERGGVVVSRVPGFCAFRMLQDGDVLLSMDAGAGTVEFTSPKHLTDSVKAIKAGQTILFEVLRQGEIVNIPITLDRRPTDGEIDRIEEFTGRRIDQADELWERDFAPLLSEQVG
jgi:hypothetical protein